MRHHLGLFADADMLSYLPYARWVWWVRYTWDDCLVEGVKGLVLLRWLGQWFIGWVEELYGCGRGRVETVLLIGTCGGFVQVTRLS